MVAAIVFCSPRQLFLLLLSLLLRKKDCCLRHWRNLQVTRSLRLRFVWRGIGPDCVALSIVVLVELLPPVPDLRRPRLAQIGDVVELLIPSPLGWRRAEAHSIWGGTHDGGLVAVADEYVQLKYT